MEDFGARVASVWEGMRSTTRNLIVLALQSSGKTAPPPARGRTSYDARSDWELSRLLSALDERAADADEKLSDEQARDLRRMAETCAVVLQEQTQSAEVFGQLVERALKTHDYARVDVLGDALLKRFVPGEMCELARHQHPIIRALAQEALALAPTAVLVSLLSDEVDADIARDALERQAFEYDNEQARQLVYALDQAELMDEEEM